MMKFLAGTSKDQEIIEYLVEQKKKIKEEVGFLKREVDEHKKRILPLLE